MSLVPLVLALAAFAAGMMNAVAGGGSFVTLPALLFAGLDPRAANITSTIALFPGQISTALAGRRLVGEEIPFLRMTLISLAGGALGALLLLATPTSIFTLLLPFLVLFATTVFAWGSFRRRPAGQARALGPVAAGLVQFAIAIYGGYYGGGIGFLMLAALTLGGIATRTAIAAKNVLATAMNAAAVLVFLFAPGIAWGPAAIVAVAAIAGGLAGAWVLGRVHEKILRGAVVAIGAALTVGLFLRG
ncbi:MAG: sulfite exporter TauE/SafE family protein [Rhodospirillales bacterium]|nr:TSUP family transporter [Rhodospirillales bacterium]MDE2198609.1 sulfite exporter TauE/SafE family protein [Rhodospirillales bacterium]